MAVDMYQLEYHELSQRWEMMGGPQIQAMADNMARNGYNPHIPIWLYEGKILDGRNRYTAAAIAGVTPTFLTFEGTWEEAEELEDVLNWHRRHSEEEALKLAREKRVKRIAARRKAGQSQRSIAEAEEISRAQVKRDLKEASTGPGGGPVEPEDGKVKGRDGKTRTATPKKPKPKPPEPIEVEEDETPEPVPEPTPPKIIPQEVDAVGVAIPDNVQEAFQFAKIVVATCKEIEAIIKKIESFKTAKGGRAIRHDSAIAQLRDAKGNLWGNRCTHVCPYCYGKDAVCNACKGEGWVPFHVYKSSPKAYEESKKK